MARGARFGPEPRCGPLALEPDAAEPVDSPLPAVGVWPVALPAPADDSVPDDPVLARPEPEATPTEVRLEEPARWLTVDDAVLVAPEAVETAVCVAVEMADPAVELAAPTADPAVDVAVDVADCAVDEAVLVAPETTGGFGTETDGPEADTPPADGDEERPEARLEDAPDPTMAAGASVRAKIRVSDFARFIDGSLLP